MGMFDSFYIKVENKDYEIQTKSLDCCLNVWTIGDRVDSITSTVLVEEVFIEKEIYVSIIIFQGIFVEYLLRDSVEVASLDGSRVLKTYMSEVNNPVVNQLMAELTEKSNQLNELNSRINKTLAGMNNVIEFMEKGNDEIFKDEDMDERKAAWRRILYRSFQDAPSNKVSLEEKYKYLLTKLKNNVKVNFPQFLPWKYNEETQDIEQEKT